MVPPKTSVCRPTRPLEQTPGSNRELDSRPRGGPLHTPDSCSWDHGQEVAQTGLFRKRNKLTTPDRSAARTERTAVLMVRGPGPFRIVARMWWFAVGRSRGTGFDQATVSEDA